ncbi:hypothetical protein Fmac_004301 [Flemingia macrophylla]|uniref:ABC transporter domain-containing protein n=1 Tax=Flemingia macrophylla TaxID=520843 RepID=A0ABD1N4I4_9FABA
MAEHGRRRRQIGGRGCEGRRRISSPPNWIRHAGRHPLPTAHGSRDARLLCHAAPPAPGTPCGQGCYGGGGDLGARAGKCQHTIIGNGFIRGVSGGEWKRVSIAHEMLVDPSLLVLDEPTSGLDSTTAHRLLGMLASLAKKGKTVVTSMHQPSSRVYQMFNKVLLLSEGQCLYSTKVLSDVCRSAWSS